MKHIAFSLFAVLLGGASLQAETKKFNQVAEVNVRFEPAEAKPGETVKFKLTLKPAEGFWTYPLKQDDARAGDAVNKIRLPNNSPILFVGNFSEPPGLKVKQETVRDITFPVQYYPGETTWEREAIIAPGTNEGMIEIALKELVTSINKDNVVKSLSNTRLQVCDKSNCYPSSLFTYKAKLTVLPGSVPVDPKYKDEVEKQLAARAVEAKKDPVTPAPREAIPTPKEVSKESAKVVPIVSREDRDHAAELEEIRKQLPAKPPISASGSGGTGLFALLATAAFWGFISLITPCVFPMIPITVSLFLKRGGDSTKKTIKLASIYCLTIIIVLGVSALTLLSVFRALSVDPYMNLALGALFIFFALSLFGMYDIALPNFMTRWTSTHEGSGIVGTVFMALTFSIVSFTCVAPFLGGFSGMAASGNYAYWELALAGLTFSTAFAAPFFVLALFPKLLKKLPKSGSWMNSVKVVMGFLEMAAALKFFRTAELRLLSTPEYFTYDLVLGMWVVLGLLCGLYLLNFYRLPHDEPQEHIAVPRLLLGFLFLTFAIYLAPGLFRQGDKGERQRPAGSLYAWVDAFLLPDPKGNWSVDLSGTIAKAREERQKTGKPQYIFVDFTGVTCTNCKYNEENVFTLPSVQALLPNYHQVQMYTDEVPERYFSVAPSKAEREEEAIQNLAFQDKVFGTSQLPLYVILEPKEDTIDIVGVYGEGKINNISGFTTFLRKPLK